MSYIQIEKPCLLIADVAPLYFCIKISRFEFERSENFLQTNVLHIANHQKSRRIVKIYTHKNLTFPKRWHLDGTQTSIECTVKGTMFDIPSTFHFTFIKSQLLIFCFVDSHPVGKVTKIRKTLLQTDSPCIKLASVPTISRILSNFQLMNFSQNSLLFLHFSTF